MDCTTFVLKVGLQEALEILGEDVWKYTKFSFEQWDQQRRDNRENPVLVKKILPKMVETASTRENWLDILCVASDSRSLVIEKIKDLLMSLTDFDQVQKWPSNTAIREVDEAWLQRLAEVANCARHWRIVCSYATCDSRWKNSDLATLGLTKMVECATKSGKVRDWEMVYHEAPSGSPAQKTALSGLARLAKTYEDWRSVWYRTGGIDDNLAKDALCSVIDKAETFDQWFSIFANSNKWDAPTRELCMYKLVKLAETFEDWKRIYQISADQIKSNALSQLLAKAETVDDWLSVRQWTPEGSEAKAKALEWLKKFVIME